MSEICVCVKKPGAILHWDPKTATATCAKCHRDVSISDPFKPSEAAEEAKMPDSLYEAGAIITGERQDTYGNPEDSFAIIADFWNTYLANRSGPLNATVMGITALDVAHMMSLFKHARLLGQRPSRDNYIDAIGYLAIAADRL